MVGGTEDLVYDDLRYAVARGPPRRRLPRHRARPHLPAARRPLARHRARSSRRWRWRASRTAEIVGQAGAAAVPHRARPARRGPDARGGRPRGHRPRGRGGRRAGRRAGAQRRHRTQALNGFEPEPVAVTDTLADLILASPGGNRVADDSPPGCLHGRTTLMRRSPSRRTHQHPPPPAPRPAARTPTPFTISPAPRRPGQRLRRVHPARLVQVRRAHRRHEVRVAVAVHRHRPAPPQLAPQQRQQLLQRLRPVAAPTRTGTWCQSSPAASYAPRLWRELIVETTSRTPCSLQVRDLRRAPLGPVAAPPSPGRSSAHSLRGRAHQILLGSCALHSSWSREVASGAAFAPLGPVASCRHVPRLRLRRRGAGLDPARAARGGEPADPPVRGARLRLGHGGLRARRRRRAALRALPRGRLRGRRVRRGHASCAAASSTCTCGAPRWAASRSRTRTRSASAATRSATTARSCATRACSSPACAGPTATPTPSTSSTS